MVHPLRRIREEMRRYRASQAELLEIGALLVEQHSTLERNTKELKLLRQLVLAEKEEKKNGSVRRS